MSVYTESDGDWVGNILDDVLPNEMDNRIWIQLEPREVEGSLVNQFKFARSDLTVMASVSPIIQKGAEARKVSYHLVISQVKGNKVKKPTVADVNRVKDTFIRRSLEPGEIVFEGPMDGSKAHHVICVFSEKSRIIAP